MIRLLSYIINIRKLFAIIFLMSISHQILTKPRISRIKEHKGTLYFGCFQELPTANFCVLYDGELIEIHDACFTIKDVMLGAVNILFVDPEKIKFTTDENNVVLGLSLGTKDYQCYQMSLTQIPVSSSLTNGSVINDYVSSWKINEKAIDDSIPLNTIIIPLNPNKITIKLDNVTGKPNNLAIKLPEIKLITKCEQTLKELMVEGYLKAIALKPFHAKQRVKSNLKNNTKISMIL